MRLSYKIEIGTPPANDKFAIGYSGLGYKTDGVRTVLLAAYNGRESKATYSGKYLIAGYLYIYLNKKPNEPLDPLRAEFIKYILSKGGQTQTEKGGYYPITDEIRENDLDALGISTIAN